MLEMFSAFQRTSTDKDKRRDSSFVDLDYSKN